MLKYMLVISLVAMVTSDFTFTCNQPPKNVGPDMPSLSDQYEMRVEANIVQYQRTIEVVEMYDYQRGLVAITMTQDGKVSKSIHNFNTQMRFDINMPENECLTSNINSSSGNFNVFGFTVKGKDGNIHIASVNDIFRMGDKFNISYVGESQIRGIPVYQWTSCQESEELHASFKLDYFFSRPSYVNADNNTNVPVTFTITGQAKNVGKSGFHNFTHVYEFSVYKPGPIKNRSVFETPRGVVCQHWNNTARLPKLDDVFSCDVEEDSARTRRPVNTKIYYDYTHKLMRMDRFYDKDEKHKYGVGLISTIQDFNTGVQYVIDQNEGNCTVEQLVPDFVLRQSSQPLHDVSMSHTQELMMLKNRTFEYQGEREWRGLTVDAWANMSDGIIREYYFLKQKAPEPGKPSPPSVVVGIYTKNLTAANNQGQGHTPGQGPHPQGQTQSPPPQGQSQGPPPAGQGPPRQGQTQGPPPQGQSQGPPPQGPSQGPPSAQSQHRPAEHFMNVYNFHNTIFDLSVFDVSACYKTLAMQSLYFTFTVSGSYYDNVYGHKSVFITSVRNTMAVTAGVSPTRVTNIQVNQDKEETSKMVITFTLLDKILIKGDVAHPPKQPSLAEAKKKIMKSANFGIHVPVKYANKPPKIFTVHTYSMKAVSAPLATAQKNVYTQGSMAGLGIGMLIFGCISGLLIAFLIHRRISTDIPYQRETS